MAASTEGPIAREFLERAERDAFTGSHLVSALMDAITQLENNQRDLETKLTILRKEIVRKE